MLDNMLSILYGFIFVGVIFYCLVGFIVGLIALNDGDLPKRRLIKDEVCGLASYRTIDWPRTVLFSILMGPFFWCALIIFGIIKLACILIDD